MCDSAYNMVDAQIGFAMTQDPPRPWGVANGSDPHECDYMTCEEFTGCEVMPYVSAMALDLLLGEARANLYSMHELDTVRPDLPYDTGTRQHLFGFRDSWDYCTNSGRDSYLYLDTGWTVLGALNDCYENGPRERFMNHPEAQQGVIIVEGMTPICGQ